jgi:hypothetical protein
MGLTAFLKFTDIYFKTYTSGQEKSGKLKLAKTENNSSQLHTLTTHLDT